MSIENLVTKLQQKLNLKKMSRKIFTIRKTYIISNGSIKMDNNSKENCDYVTEDTNTNG